MVPMMVEMAARGPESAGLAVFTGPIGAERRKFSLYAPSWSYDWSAFEAEFIRHFGTDASIEVCGNHAVLECDESVAHVKPWIATTFPQLHMLAAGRAMDIYKDIGHPAAVADRYDFTKLTGTHLVGHTRMATESAVTPDRAHPFTAGEDFCLVHNGTISNPYMIRRKLEHHGIRFETDNDTEAACRYLEWRMREGDDLESALQKGFEELDGFYTFLIGTGDKLALVRDAFACKPAIVAETDDYVAVASEFRALAHLPGIDHAKLFEPMPEEIYSWKV
jgi:amidophosphoribosyltransferase